MLARGYANKDIQFFFNRPDRAVNSGRISEIKAGERGIDVAPASDHDLDEFLDHHPYAAPYRPADEPEIPEQLSSASRFRIEDNGTIGTADGTHLPFSEPDASEAYAEVRSKAAAVLAIGDNSLGEERHDVEVFVEALPADASEASTIKVWMRGNALRAVYRAHVEVADEDFHPAKLDTLCASRLSDLVEAFNVLAAIVPELAERDAERLGPDSRKDFEEAVGEFSGLLDDAKAIATDEAYSELAEELATTERVPPGPEQDRQTALVGSSIYNFLVTGVKGVYRRIRRTAGREAGELWKATKTAVYEKVGLGALAGVWTFLATHYPIISDIFAKLTSNPVVQAMLDLIMKLVG